MKCFPLGGFLVSVAIRGDCCVRGFKDLFVAFFFFFKMWLILEQGSIMASLEAF